jgi:hypothetical protein
VRGVPTAPVQLTAAPNFGLAAIQLARSGSAWPEARDQRHRQPSSRQTAMSSHPAVVRLFRISEKPRCNFPAGPQRDEKWGISHERGGGSLFVDLFQSDGRHST